MADSSTKSPSEKQNILITGGSGLVGTRLSEKLADKGYKVSHLSRSPTNGKYPSFRWDVQKKEVDEDAITQAGIIVHLAGAGVAEKQWSEKRKKEINDSRMESTRFLFDQVKAHKPDLEHFIAASAIGYYGWDTEDQWVDESDPKGQGFLADVVENWEKEVERFGQQGISHTSVRMGVVLSMDGGALVEMAKPMRWGMGAALGSGNQYMSWTHIDDICGIFIHLMENRKSGIYNGVAPNPVTNKLFTKTLAKAMKKPMFLPNVPAFLLKLVLGERAWAILGGNRVSSKKIEQAGFDFQYHSLDSGLKNLMNG